MAIDFSQSVISRRRTIFYHLQKSIRAKMAETKISTQPTIYKNLFPACPYADYTKMLITQKTPKKFDMPLIISYTNRP